MAQQIITVEPITGINLLPRVDFDQSGFDTIIEQKGRTVIFSKALQCPCKGPATNQQSNCKNCGGTGWVYVNPTQTRMVLQTMNVSTNYLPNFETEVGTLQISCKSEEAMTQFDKIQLTDSTAIFNESVTVKQKQSSFFAFTKYKIKSVIYLGLFNGTNQAFTRLYQDTDFTFEGNILVFLSAIPAESQITIRYVYYPEYVIIEMKRESMETFKYSGFGESIENMPMSATGRKMHLLGRFENLQNDRLLDNSFPDDCNC